MNAVMLLAMLGYLLLAMCADKNWNAHAFVICTAVAAAAAAAAAARLDNIMEHWSCCDNPCAARDRVLLDAVPQFKLFDFGTAVIYPGGQLSQQQCIR
jgi:hypothetical protein